VLHIKYESCDKGVPLITATHFVTCVRVRHLRVPLRRTGRNIYVLECYVMQNTFKHVSALLDQREACSV